MSTTRYKIRLWEYDGEASVANAVTFDSFDEAQARFNDLRVSEEMPCVEFIKERIANGCIIGDEVLNVRQFTSVFDAITKEAHAGGLPSFPSGHRSAVGRRVSRTLLRRVRRGQLRRLPERAVPEQSGMVAFPSGGGGGTMTADRARGALAVLQDADGKFICEVPCGYIVEQTASAHKPRRIQAQRRRRAMLRRRVALTVALLTVAALLAALMPWSGSGAADKPKDTTAGTLEEVHQPTAVLLPSSGTVAEYVPNAAEVEALAKLIYGEAGIVPSTTEQAAVVWCVLNRVDDPRFPDTVLEVIEAPYQFSGYDPEYPVKEEFALLAADVLTRYRAERDGEENVGRVLPAEYCFFTGDGRRNHFTTEWKSTDCFGWTLESPYTD